MSDCQIVRDSDDFKLRRGRRKVNTNDANSIVNKILSEKKKPVSGDIVKVTPSHEDGNAENHIREHVKNIVFHGSVW